MGCLRLAASGGRGHSGACRKGTESQGVSSLYTAPVTRPRPSMLRNPHTSTLRQRRPSLPPTTLQPSLASLYRRPPMYRNRWQGPELQCLDVIAEQRRNSGETAFPTPQWLLARFKKKFPKTERDAMSVYNKFQAGVRRPMRASHYQWPPRPQAQRRECQLTLRWSSEQGADPLPQTNVGKENQARAAEGVTE